MPLFDFTNEDMAILREVVSREKSRKQNRDIVDSDGELRSKPDIFVALPPSSGIPPIARATGTPPDEGDKPGYADCGIYQVIGGAIRSCGFEKRVYNFSDDTVSGDWVTVVRDKYGTFMVPTGSIEEAADDGTGTMAGTDCDTIPGVDFDDVPVSASPSYVLGITTSGCLVKIEVAECTGTGT